MHRSNSTSQPDQLMCQEHVGISVSHVCINPTCLIPLCPKCIKDHNNMHKMNNTYPEIELVEDVKKMCANKVEGSLNRFENQLQKIQDFASQANISVDGLQRIQASKKALYELIESYYRDLETYLVKSLSMSEIQKNSPRSYKAYGRIKTYIEKLEVYNSALQKNQFIQLLQPMLTTDFEKDLERISASYDEERAEKQIIGPEVLIDPNFLQDFQKLLRSYVKIQNGSEPIERRSVSPVQRKSSVKRKKVSSFQIKIENYYEKDIFKRYLHFFQHKSKNLFLLDVDQCEKEGAYDFERIELDINFKIPRWHRSVATPFGEIYLTGGVDVEKTDVKLEQAYVYDFNNTTLIEIANMNCGRSGHALVYLQGYLYAIGGFSHSKEFTRQCERYNIRHDAWEQIASLNVGSNNPCACSFNDEYIFKFGGKIDDLRLCNYIEKYDPSSDKWIVIQYELIGGDGLQSVASSLLLSSSACCQVNEKEIFIFGGTHADYSQKSNSSFLLHIEDDPKKDREDLHSYSIRNYNDYPLPVAEGFWNNQATIVDGRMYCLQNIQNEKNVSIVYLDRRRILKFHPEAGWVTLN